MTEHTDNTSVEFLGAEDFTLGYEIETGKVVAEGTRKYILRVKINGKKYASMETFGIDFVNDPSFAENIKFYAIAKAERALQKGKIKS